MPDLSPRLTNSDSASAIALKACLPVPMPATFAGSSFGPTSTKSLYITSKRSLGETVGHELVLGLAAVYEQYVRVALASRSRSPGRSRPR